MAHIRETKPDSRNEKLTIWYNSGMNYTNIYALSDPRTNEIRYIGKSNDVNRRLRRHLKDGRDGIKRDHKSNWIAMLHRLGMTPIVSILETCPIESWKERERYWIAMHRATCDLTNSKDGGDGLDVNDEVRARMSAAAQGRVPHNKGAITPDDIREKQRESARRRWDALSPDERRAACPQLLTHRPPVRVGWKHTPEALAKIAAASTRSNAESRSFTDEQAREIREQLEGGAKGATLARKYGVPASRIYSIKYGRTYAKN